jgi:hypothetical protein
LATAAILNDVQAVGHNFERGPPKDNSSQSWFNLVQWFSGEDLNVKVYDVRRTDGRMDTRQMMVKACMAFAHVS